MQESINFISRFIDTDNDFVRVKNYVFFVYIGHKIRLEVWQRYLNFIVLKKFLQSIFKEYKEQCSHALFDAQVEELENLRAKQELPDFYRVEVSSTRECIE